jgi:hypothetical protein
MKSIPMKISGFSSLFSTKNAVKGVLSRKLFPARASLLLASAAFSYAVFDEARAQGVASQTLALSSSHFTPLVYVQASNQQREVIMQIQRSLQALGLYDMVVDGVAGPGTLRAIERFLRLAGLTPRDGRFGPEEFSLLRLAVEITMVVACFRMKPYVLPPILERQKH